MLGALILLVLIISVIVLIVKVRGQRRRIDKLENKVYEKKQRILLIEVNNFTESYRSPPAFGASLFFVFAGLANTKYFHRVSGNSEAILFC